MNGDKATPMALSVQDLTVVYDTRPALWDLDMEVPQGVLMGIVGPNGAGKSTLIKAALNLLPRAAGSVNFFGQPYQKVRERVGYVPQRGSVDWDFPTTVIDVVGMGLYGKLGWLRPPGKKERVMTMDALAQVGLQDFAHRQISRLSGGQQQRTFLARALVQNADIYFMDEPFAAVDAVTEKAILQILQQLRSRGKTVIVVHHDLQTVADYFDWVALINVTLFATGPISAVFTNAMIERTYGVGAHSFHSDDGMRGGSTGAEISSVGGNGGGGGHVGSTSGGASASGSRG